MGDEEKYKHVTVVAKERKLFQKKELDFVHRARSLNKPFCTSCFKFDYDNNSLRDFSEYTTADKISEHILKDRKTRMVLGKMYDFECPNGHKISVEMTNDDLSRTGNIDTKNSKGVQAKVEKGKGTSE